MNEEILELQKKVKVLEQQLTEKEKIIKDPSKRGYYALCHMLNQQIEYLEKFKLEDHIGASPKDDKTFERAKGIWEGIKTLITDCRFLKQELSVTNEEEDAGVKRIVIKTPESIAAALGQTAGQNY